MSFTSLRDGGLSVTVGGADYVPSVRGLEWESTLNGDGAASFWMEVSDPRDPQADYPALTYGAPVIVNHTLSGVTTRLYTGYVISDPRAGYLGERKVVNVECAGLLEMAKARTDLAFVFTDSDTQQWFENKRNPKIFQCDTSDKVRIEISDGTVIKQDQAAVLGYAAYEGAEYMLGPMRGVRRITGKVAYNLKEGMKARLVWSRHYKNSRRIQDFQTICTWEGTSGRTPDDLDVTFSDSQGAGYVALIVWQNNGGKTTLKADHYIEIDPCIVYTDLEQQRVDQGMLSIAQLIGHATGYDTAPIGSVMQSLVARPYTDPVSALASFAAQAEGMVEWGWFGGRFRAKPMLYETIPYGDYVSPVPGTIRALPNCYKVDPYAPSVKSEVVRRPDDDVPRAIRFIYGRAGSSAWPAGQPASVIAPEDVGWNNTDITMGTTARVMTADFSSRNYPDKTAKSLARALFRRMGAVTPSGPVTISSPTISDFNGNSVPAPYIHGADWIDGFGTSSPLYITRAHVTAETGVVDLDVGLSARAIVEQLIAAGRVKGVTYHHRHLRHDRY